MTKQTNVFETLSFVQKKAIAYNFFFYKNKIASCSC